MRPLIYLAVLLSLLVSGCRRETLQQQIEGDYAGVFYREIPNAKTLHANVSLHFARGQFTGLSNLTKYPAICQGRYGVEGNTLSVSNTCAFTTEFDWTYIFNGRYEYALHDSRLRIWKSYPDGTRDLYILEK